MKLTRNFVLPLAALFIGLLLVPRSAQAQVENCPAGPLEDVPIADGETFSGSNCVLNATGAVDSFVFSADEGQTYQLALAVSGAVNSNVCLALYDPNNNLVFSGCTAYSNGYGASVVVDQALTVTGTYYMDVTESSNTTQGYAVSLERLDPFPPNAVQITTFGTVYNGDVAPTESNAFTFSGVTTGTYEVTAGLTGSVNENLCLAVYASNGTLVSPSMGTTNPGCTAYSNGFGASVSIDFTPTQAGTYMALAQGQSEDTTQTYTLVVSCLAGKCTQTYPPCTLKDAASYNATSKTLTMDFTVGNNVATTWNAWLTSQNTIPSLFSLSQPITVPPVPITKTTTLSPSGTVGVLSTLTTPTKGIFCSSYVQINTGKP